MANQYNTKILMIGDIYDDMKIIELISKNNHNYYVVECIYCGRRKELRRDRILKSIGTHHKNCCEQINPKDDLYYDFYKKWRAMRTRTTNKNQKSWKHYYDISSDYYKYFVDFYDDMFESYVAHRELYGKENTTLDRINPYGDYEKENIRWATRFEQNQPKSKREFKRVIGISPYGDEVLIENRKEFCKKYNISQSELSKSLKDNKTHPKGWSFKLEE